MVQSEVITVGIQIGVVERIDDDVLAQLLADFLAGEDHLALGAGDWGLGPWEARGREFFSGLCEGVGTLFLAGDFDLTSATARRRPEKESRPPCADFAGDFFTGSSTPILGQIGSSG